MLGTKIKALFLLHSFLGVQLISIACTFANLAHDISHAQTAHEEHHHGHSHQHSESEKQDTDTENDNCCVENASIFLSGIEAIPLGTDLILPLCQLQLSSLLDNRLDSACLFQSIIGQIRPPPLISEDSSLFRIIIQVFQI